MQSRKPLPINRLTAEFLYGTSTAFTGRAPRCGKHKVRELMKKDRKEIESSEPLGIIISRGDRTEPTPMFSAYIWGPVPEAATAAAESANRAA